MAQSVWHKSDIARIAATMMAMAPSDEFAAGVMALATALGAEVQPPKRRGDRPVAVEVRR